MAAEIQEAPKRKRAPTAIRRRASRSRKARVQMARVDGAEFNRFVLKHEETGAPVRNAPYHDEWHADMDEHDRIVLWGHVESGKTQQISVGRVLFELGQNPELRTVIISATSSAATKIGTVVKQYIEESDELHEVFPKLQPGGKKWTENAFTVRRKSRAKDASVQSVGMYGMIYGARIDRLVLDDVLRWENIQTHAARDKSERWLKSTLWGRLTARAKVRFLGNAWHPKDAMHNLGQNSQWLAKRYPVLDEKGNSVWPEQWSLERIAKFKIDPGPLEYARQLMCVSQDESTRRCPDAWINLCKEEGEGVRMMHALNTSDRSVVPEGCFTVTGVDLASSKKKSALQKLSAKTVIFTILVYPNEDRQVLWVDSGQFKAPEIRDKVIEHHDRYGSTVFVEDNGVQAWMIELVSEIRAIPILAFHTGMNKWDPKTGVETVFVEFSNSKWVIPSLDAIPLSQEVIEWLAECSNFHPSAHTGDHLMACVPPGHLVTTTRGLVPIERVADGDLVLTHRGRFRRVTGTEHFDYSGGVVRLRQSGGTPLVVTDDHHVWSAASRLDARDGNRLKPTRWEWRPAMDLRAGRKLAGQYVLAPRTDWPAMGARFDLSECVQAPKKHGGSWRIYANRLDWQSGRSICPRWLDLDEDAARLVGIYLAEGSVGGNPHIAVLSFHRRERHLCDYVAGMAERLFTAGSSTVPALVGEGVTQTIRSAIAARWFLRFGKTSQHKSIPWEWMGLPLRLRLAIVQGWLMGDGCLTGNKIKGVSTSSVLIQQAVMILRDSGFLPAVCPFKNKPFVPGGSVLPAWQVSLSRTDSARMIKEAGELGTAHWGRPGPTRQRTNTRSLAIDQGTAVRLTRLESMRYDGPVYNLHVEDDESFVCEGIAIHNSWFAKEGARYLWRRRRDEREHDEGDEVTIFDPYAPD